MTKSLMDLPTSFPRYLASADETEYAKVQWWARHEATLPNWASVVKKILLVQPSSASAERVFNIMKNVFRDQQNNALEETVETSAMLC